MAAHRIRLVSRWAHQWKGKRATRRDFRREGVRGKLDMTYWREKVVLVTGGSAGLGFAIAKEFLQAEARVVVVARDAGRMATAAEELKSYGAVTPLQADVTQSGDVGRLFETVRERFGRLDALVNNVGRSTRGWASETTPEQFQEYWETNFLSAVRCTQAGLPLLLSSRGHLVHVGSLASKSATPLLGAYASSKFALAAYAQQLRLELKPRGVHVLLACPGPMTRADEGERYRAQSATLPEAAKQPGGGVKLKTLEPAYVAGRIRIGCERREAEIVLPWKAKLLFALAQLSPAWGDWLLAKTSST